MAKTSKQALLIDGNALIHRAWHALPPLTAPDGKIVNAVFGFANILLKLLPAERPDYLVVCWDTPEPTFRHEAAPEYKAQRVEQPQDFYDQFPLVQQVVEAMGGHNIEMPGYEADDLIGTLAVRLAAADIDVTVLSSDRDLWQLIAPHVRIMAFKKGVTDTLIYDAPTLKEVTGLTPEQIVDYKALRGDASDNLKGVPGIGEKTATDLLLAFHDFEGVFKAAHDEKSDLSPSVRKKLVEGEMAARATLPLVRLQLEAPIKLANDAFIRKEVDVEQLKKVFLTFGFKSLVSRLGGEKTSKAQEPIIATEPPMPKTMAKAKKASTNVHAQVTNSERITISKAADVSAVLKRVDLSQGVVLWPALATQGSLFAENTGLVLAFSGVTVLVPDSIFSTDSVKAEVGKLLKDASVAKIGHDIKAAVHWAWKRGFEVGGLNFDTEVAAYLLAAGEGGYDLETLAASRLQAFFTEDESRPFAQAEAIRALADMLRGELEVEKLMPVFEKFELPLIPVLAKMEEAGILLDCPYLKTLSEDFRKDKERIEKEMQDLAGEHFNPASPAQLGHVLFDVLKIPSKGLKRGKTGISTAASELEKIEGAHPIVEKIGEYREVAKLLSTYVETLPTQVDKDSRVHTTYSMTVAATGRLSSLDPNLQNIPIRTELGRKIRKAFIAPKGSVLLSCDYSQIQLRIVAALAKDEKMLDAFRRGLDIHTATAAGIWGVNLDEVTADQRRAAKTINFGVLYGQGPQALSKGAGISFAEAKQFIADYFRVYSGVREYLDQVKALAHAQGYVETMFGRRRPIPEINSPIHMVRAGAERMAINMPVQGTEADIMKLGLIAVAKELPKLDDEARILLQVHDELVFEVPESSVASLAPKIVEIMRDVTSIGCPIVVEAKVGKNWEEMTKLK